MTPLTLSLQTSSSSWDSQMLGDVRYGNADSIYKLYRTKSNSYSRRFKTCSLPSPWSFRTINYRKPSYYFRRNLPVFFLYLAQAVFVLALDQHTQHSALFPLSLWYTISHTKIAYLGVCNNQTFFLFRSLDYGLFYISISCFHHTHVLVWAL